MSFSFKPLQTGVSPQSDLVSPNSGTSSIQSEVPLGDMVFRNRGNEGSGVSLIQIILYLVFAITVIIAASLFGYRYYLISSIDVQKKALFKKDELLKSIDLDKMRSVSDRMKVVNQVLSEHSSVSTAFLILEKTINDSVTYKNFDLKKSSTGRGYDLKMGSVASSYKAVYQQLETFKNDEKIKSLVSDISYDGPTLDSTGNVNFGLKMNVLIQGKLPESVFIDKKANNSDFDKVEESVSGIQNASTTATSTNVVTNNKTATSSVQAKVIIPTKTLKSTKVIVSSTTSN